MRGVGPKRPWTPEEDALIAKHYARRGGPQRLAQLLPNRSDSSIVCRASKLRVPVKGSTWLPEEDAVLLAEWQDVGPRVLRQKLRNRGWSAIVRRAALLGLPQGIPQGYVSVSAAARQAGYSRPALVSLLNRHGVPTPRFYGVTTTPGKLAIRYVSMEAVEIAVAADVQLETFDDAGRRHGLSRNGLCNRLKRVGAYVPVGRGSRARIDPAAVDAAMAAWERTVRTARCAHGTPAERVA